MTDTLENESSGGETFSDLMGLIENLSPNWYDDYLARARKRKKYLDVEDVPLPGCDPSGGSTVEVCYNYGKDKYGKCPMTCNYAQEKIKRKGLL